MTTFVYQIENIVNGKKYIGLTSGLKRRLWLHEHGYGSGLVASAIKKYGRDNIRFDVLFECSNHEYAGMLEIGLIKYFNCMPPNGYNLTMGGEGTPLMPEHVEKLSQAMSGENHPMYGKKHSLATKKKMSKTRTGRKLTTEHSQNISAAKKKNMNSKTKQKISKGLTGRSLSDAHRAALSAAQQLRRARERGENATQRLGM